MRVTLQREHAGLNTPSPQVTQQTVRKMCEHIRQGAADPLILSTAQSVAPMGPDKRMAPSDALARLWYWVKLHVKFVPDEAQTLKMFGESDNFELLISPPVLIRMPQPAGDCDCFTMLLLALARSLGFDTRIITLMCDRRRPGEYTHVFGSAFAPDLKAWIPLDASHGDYPGWEVPARDVTRRTEWNMSGQIVTGASNDARSPIAGSDVSAGLASLNDPRRRPSLIPAVWDPPGYFRRCPRSPRAFL